MNYQDFYSQSIADPVSFWKEQATVIDWFKFPTNILSKNDKDLFEWYQGGQLNTSYLALDYHVNNGRAEQTALIYDSPVTNTLEKYTYRELLDEVELVAGMLTNLGVEKGDRVIIYMPMIPQTAFAMLACARIGAVHSVVFGGFAANELAIRIDDSKPKVILTASGGIETNRTVAYMPTINAGIEQANYKVEKVVVYQRPQIPVDGLGDRDIDWMTLRASAKATSYTAVEATDPLYILYTSGTTGKPKGIMRDNGGHAVAMKFSMKYVYGIDPGEVYWAASDVGWVVGHSYIVYAPLIHGCTTVLFEGKPIKTPDAGTFWRVIEQHKVNVFFTAPTAFRAIIKEDSKGELLKKYDLSSLRLQFLAGERCDVTTLSWLQERLNIPVLDHWWQTESGWPMLANMAGIELLDIKPGSACKPVAGFDVQVLNSDGQVAQANEEGVVVVKYPLPPGCLPDLWQDTERFKSSYLSQFPGYYFSGDGGYKDEDGYIFITGRIDDIINVAGHRLSTAEMEEVVAAHEAVAECAVIGITDELKGQIPVGFIILKSNVNISPEDLEKELILMVRNKIGPVASFKRAVIADRLPKTRSGKILRKIMRYIADGQDFNPPSTIEDMAVLGELKEMMKRNEIGKEQ